MTIHFTMTGPTESTTPSEPMLVTSMRRRHREQGEGATVRIVRGSGTTVATFLAEFDVYAAEVRNQALLQAAAELDRRACGGTAFNAAASVVRSLIPGERPGR